MSETAKLSVFEREALSYFQEKVPAGYTQRIDGIACFSPLSGYRFWRWRLDRMVKKGLLRRRGHPSIWRSCDGMPGYGLPAGSQPSEQN